MISKGDLVKMRLSVANSSGENHLSDMWVIGKVMNYCEDEGTYIVEPRMISVSKEQVREIETLPSDFDFQDVSMELRVSEQQRAPEKPPEVNKIRFSRGR